jgi:hypothetical protein
MRLRCFERRLDMELMRRGQRTRAVPKRKQRHYSYDESVDEPAGLIADEPAEIEEEVPAEENEPLERIDDATVLDSPAFEEGS